MASLEWHYTHTGGITLVELLVTTAYDQYVSIESRLTPCWPPRRHGRHESGWHETGYEGPVRADERLVLGYASPAAPRDPPAELVEERPLTDEASEQSLGTRVPESGAEVDISLTDGRIEVSDGFADRSTGSCSRSPEVDEGVYPPSADETRRARELVRLLGEVRPPREAVPIPLSDSSAKSGEGGSEGETSDAGNSRDETLDVGEMIEYRDDGTTERQLDARLSAIERRIRDARRFSAVECAQEARTLIARAGGIEGVRSLHEQLEADREWLETLETRCEEASTQLDAVDVPVETLERLA